MPESDAGSVCYSYTPLPVRCLSTAGVGLDRRRRRWLRKELWWLGHTPLALYAGGTPHKVRRVLTGAYKFVDTVLSLGPLQLMKH